MGATPAFTASDATYSAHFRKKSGKQKNSAREISKIRPQKYFPSFGINKQGDLFSDEVYLLGGYVHLELPIPLSAYLSAMNTTCHAVHKAYQDKAFDGYPLLVGTLAALDGDCVHAERSVSSLVRSMGTLGIPTSFW